MQWRPIRPVLLLVILVAGVGVAGAAGTGTFILQDTIAGVGERAGTTLSLNTTWDPPASELWMTLRFDPAIVRYEDSRSLVGGTFSATRIRAGSILVLVSDPARFRTGPLVEFEFSGLTNGTSPLELEIGHVRAYPEGRPVDLADTAFIRQGTFVVLAGSPATPTAVIPTTVTSNRTPVAVMTSPPPLLPLTLPSPSMLPTTILLGDDYTGAVSQTPTPYPTGTMPVGNRTVLEIITRNPDFSIFTRAVNEANVTAVLDGPGPVTVFVPTDAAFSSLPPGTLEELFADETELKVLIGYHLAPGTRSVADITSSAFVPT
ncbi:MAG TPA: fasciclin domain-containing protein, partial [Methanoregulaceae archaeon]|nr:fasciclin domain-containing protein [Methanoregulaceae archaeon]